MSKRESWSPATLAARVELAGLGTADAPLGPLCTYRVGGPAALLIEVVDRPMLDGIAEVVRRTGVRTLMIGRGSNLLVADRGFDGLAIVLGPAFAEIDTGLGDQRIGSLRSGTEVLARVGGAALLPVVARTTVGNGLTGFEWAVGVPGSIGGAVRMNAGGHGADMADSLVRAEIMDLETAQCRWWTAQELDMRYRQSIVGPAQVVLQAELRLAVGAGGEADQLSEIVRWRRAHQPGGANAGSVFANPPGDSAGRLIDSAGLKGYRIGSASVSTKHANFIQAEPGGSADDIHRLVLEVIERVDAEFGIRLRPENRMIGFDR